jgi:predicted transcriptional regulator
MRRAARSRIVVTNNDTTQHGSSEEDDDVISIHSSSSFEDFDTMWEKHVAREQSRETAGVALGLLATQPTLTAPTWTETTTGITTVDTTTTATNNKDSANSNTSKLAKMSFCTMKQRDAHPPPRVSLSPRKLLSPNKNAPTRKLGNNNVTTMMLEAVVTGASHDGDNVFTNRVDAVMKQERKVDKKKKKKKKQSRNDGNDAKLATDANRDFVSSSFANHSNELESTTSTNGKKELSVSKTKSLDTNKKPNKSDEESKRDSSHKPQQQKKAASSSSQTSKSLDANKKKQKKDSATNVSTDTSVHSSDANKHSRNKTASTESTLLLVVAPNHPSQQQQQQQQQQVKDKKQVKPSLESKEKVKTDSSQLTMTSKSNDKAATTTAGTKRKSGSSSSASATKRAPPLKKPKRTFQDEILLKMLLSCKPYTLKTLAHAVGSTEAAIHHVMLSLVDKGIVIKKEFSSTKSVGGGRTKDLYWANQTSSAKQVQALELPSREEMIAVKEEFASYRAKHSLYSRELQLIEQEPSNEQLNKQLLEMERAVSMAKTTLQETKDRIAASKQDTTSCGIQQNPLMLKKRINHMRDEWKDRKTKCRDFVDQLADGLEKPIKAVVKLLELETDEMEGVTVPPKYDVGKK